MNRNQHPTLKSKELLINFSILILPVIFCLTIFFMNGIKQTLTLKTHAQVSSVSSLIHLIITFYTTNFVHYTLEHLTGNLLNYLIFGFLSLFIYRSHRVYRHSFIAILLVVPFANSALSYFFFSSINIGKTITGFSAIVAAVMGMFAVGVILPICSNEKDIMLGYFFILFASVYYFAFVYSRFFISLAFLTLSILSFTAIVYRNRKEPPKKFFTALIFVFFYLIYLGSIFPRTIVSKSGITNIPAHLIGLVLGIIIAYTFSVRYRNLNEVNGSKF